MRFERATQRRVGALLAATEPQDGRAVTADDFADVPAPVRRYFERVLDLGQPVIRRGTLSQRGEFRLDTASDVWYPLSAREWFTTQPPGFVWDATIDVAPLVPVRVVDAYQQGEGELDARVRSILPVANAGPSPAMNEGELVRYLAEAVWYPTALLPSAGVEWEAIDDRSARARLTDGDVTASVVFHVDADDRIERVTAERYRQETDDYAPWVGTFDAYTTHEGIEVPTAAEVAWQLPGGDEPYWRATVDPGSYITARHATVAP